MGPQVTGHVCVHVAEAVQGPQSKMQEEAYTKLLSELQVSSWVVLH